MTLLARRDAGFFALLCLPASSFLRFLSAVGVALDLEDLGGVHEPVDECGGAARVGEHFVPLAEGAVGGQHDRLVAMAPGDDLEEEVAMAGAECEVADLVEHEHGRARVATQPASQSMRGFLGSEVVEHLARGDAPNGVPREQRFVREIERDRRLAETVAADEYDVGDLGDEVEAEQVLDPVAVDRLWASSSRSPRSA